MTKNKTDEDIIFEIMEVLHEDINDLIEKSARQIKNSDLPIEQWHGRLCSIAAHLLASTIGSINDHIVRESLGKKILDRAHEIIEKGDVISRT